MDHIPERIELKKQSRVLELSYSGEPPHQLSFELLRVLSPSAEVQGHGRPVLQYGKQSVTLNGIERAGNYALKLIFSDGHDSGLFTWEYLRTLCLEQETLWADYLTKLEATGLSR